MVPPDNLFYLATRNNTPLRSGSLKKRRRLKGTTDHLMLYCEYAVMIFLGLGGERRRLGTVNIGSVVSIT